MTCSYARREGFEPPTARSVGWCSASIWSAPDGSGLLTLSASSVQTDPGGSCRIVRMIKQSRRQAEPGRVEHRIQRLVLSSQEGPRSRRMTARMTAGSLGGCKALGHACWSAVRNGSETEAGHTVT